MFFFETLSLATPTFHLEIGISVRVRARLTALRYAPGSPVLTMECTPLTLSRIAERSRTLYERIQDPSPRMATDGEVRASALLEKWRRAFSPKDPPAFEQRLSWDGLDVSAVSRAVAAAAGEPVLPGWTTVLVDALKTCGDVGSIPPEAHSEIPFGQVLAPFLFCARERAGTGVRNSMSRGAWKMLEHELMKQLSSVASMALYQSWVAHRESGRPSSGGAPLNGDSEYKIFVQAMLSGGLRDFFLEFSVLARQLCQLVMTWVDSVQEFVQRFEADRSLIASRFARDGDPGSIDSLRPGLSDRHDRGRQVIALTLTSGLRLIYKPRDVGLTERYESLLRWVSERGLDQAPAWLVVLGRGGYGWIEYVDHQPVGSVDEARLYFRRAGALLCLAYLLEGRDLHMDNVICAGPRGPVVVDVEALFQPSAQDPAQGTFQKARDSLQRSVINSGLLSFQQTDADGRVFDIGGFCGRGGHLSTRENRVWKFVGTDSMEPVFETLIAEPMENVVRLKGEILAPSDFQKEIAEGFEKTYRFLIDHRQELLESHSPLSGFVGESTRLIFRPSNLYALLQSKLIAPEYQKEGVDGSLLIDSLNRVFAGSPSRPGLWPLVADERSALERLDIPLFKMGIGDTRILSDSGEAVDDHFRKSGLEVVMDRLRFLSPEDLARQIDLMRGALSGLAELFSSAHESPVPDTPPLTREELLSSAMRIAGAIHERAIRGDDGGATWIAPAYLRLDDRTDQGVSYYLYDGAAGISLFLAALNSVAHRPLDRELALAALRPIEMVMKSEEPSRLLEQEGIGICNGLGSVVYSLTVVAALLDEEKLIDLARRVALEITDAKIARDRQLDMEGGAAGAIIALLELFNATGDRQILSRAVACGEHLLSHQLPASRGGSWKGEAEESPALAGLAHGAAGFAFALARLSAVTGQTRFLEAARRAVGYERSIYSSAEGNWPVLLSDGGSLVMTAWCHGAPGLALGRLGSLGSINGEETSEEIEQALRTTSNSGMSPIDHLCCGNLGRAEVLLTAGRRLGRPALVFEAERRIAAVVRRAETLDSYSLRLSEEENLSFQPGFFRGFAGIGYQLLRMVEPSLPSILSFEGAARPRRETRR